MVFILRDKAALLGETVTCRGCILGNMNQSSGSDDRSARSYAEASEILRAVNPPTIATLLFLVDDTVYTQKEIADGIGYSRTTVSQSQQSLEALPLSLATKQGSRYKITSDGETILGYYIGMARQLDVDLDTVDWQSDNAHEQVKTVLTPLYDSRSTMPFFVLESIGTRAVGGQITRLATPQRVSIEDVIQDVTVRQRERDERATSKQIRQVVRRFNDRGAVEFDGDYIDLKEKGQEHAYLLEQVVQLIEDQASPATDETEGSGTVVSGIDSQADTTHVDQPGVGGRNSQSTNIANQVQPHGFHGERPSVDDRQETRERESAVPVYCLRPTVEEGKNSTSSSEEHPTPVVPFTALTVGELIERAQQLAQEYDMDTQLEPYWMIRAESELYPMRSVDDLPSDFSQSS
jgi:biotin operon repressor